MRKLGSFIALFVSLLATSGAGCAAPEGAGPEVTGESLGVRQEEINVPCPEKADYCNETCEYNERNWTGKCDPDDGGCICLPEHGAGPGYSGSMICYYTLTWTSWGWQINTTWCFPAN